jgi:CRP-like cAMP-binding protein
VALERDIAALQANALFALFDPEALRLIAFSTDNRTLRKDDILFRLGDTSDGAYFILSGTLALMAAESEQIHGPGTLIGEAALFVETQRPATAVALEPLSVRRIPRHLIRRVLTEFPETAERMRQHMGDKVSDLGVRLNRLDRLLPDAV